MTLSLLSLLSLRFRASDSKSTIICTWQNGEIVQHYNGHKPYRTSLTEPPASVPDFEAICRKKFQLGLKWQCTNLIGERA